MIGLIKIIKHIGYLYNKCIHICISIVSGIPIES